MPSLSRVSWGAAVLPPAPCLPSGGGARDRRAPAAQPVIHPNLRCPGTQGATGPGCRLSRAGGVGAQPCRTPRAVDPPAGGLGRGGGEREVAVCAVEGGGGAV